jgi:hypothetical protein
LTGSLDLSSNKYDSCCPRLSSRLSDGENASFIVNVLLQTDTRKKFFSWFALNYFRYKWNDTAILHDRSSSFFLRKTSTSGNKLAIAEDLSAFGFSYVRCHHVRKIPSSILGGNNVLMEKFWLQFSLDRKQAGINLRMVNWNYFLKNAALTAIHANISFLNGFGHLPEKYSILILCPK